MGSPNAHRIQAFRALTEGVPGVEYRAHRDLITRSGAVFSTDGRYRYLLWRQWSAAKFCAFIMLNPSDADAREDDATIKRCTRLATNWGYTGIVVANLFAYIATHPSELERCRDPEGPHNRLFVGGMLRSPGVTRVVLAWGDDGSLHARAEAFLVDHAEAPLYCIADPTKGSVLTKLGAPRHPVRLSLKSRTRRLRVNSGRLELDEPTEV